MMQIYKSISTALLLLIMTYAISGVSAFLSTTSRLHSSCVLSVNVAQHILTPCQPRKNDVLPSMPFSCSTETETALHMNNYKSPDEENSYNDDAFGLLFLAGGSQDVDFGGTFLVLSAIAAITKQNDDRAPAAVASMSLLISPVVSSLRQTGSLENISPPIPIEIGLCAISAIWAFVNWSRGRVS